MNKMNEYLETKPFDLYELHLLRLLASSGSFTRAGAVAGLTQSAMTRQVRGVEDRLGVRLFERTTRKVSLTAAGQLLLNESRHITGDVEALIKRVREDFGGAAREVRVGLTRSVGLACYPGFLFANQRKYPELTTRIRQGASETLLREVEDGDLDVAVTSRRPRLPSSLRMVHRFRDDFVLIAPATNSGPASLRKNLKSILPWAREQTWILIEESTATGLQLHRWMRKNQLEVMAAMQADNFDLIINLVALGYGVSFVPHRALALYNHKKGLRRIPLKDRFSRELVVLVRRHPAIAEHVEKFVENILF